MPDPASPILLVLAGPAGSGKSTLCERLVAAGTGFSRVITTTTRAPRPGEIDGEHYHFLTPVEFDARIAAGEFLEWAWVHGERRYGTLASSVLDPLGRGKSLVVNLDVQGVASLREARSRYPLLDRNLATVFIQVSHEQLQRRIRERGQDDEAEIARRMATAQAEIREAAKFDYQIQSASKDEDYAALLAIIDQARARLAGGE
ncbi:MAG: guanylate kinase [Cephaloticoccus sp.]|nr:guanylate kinase [Cephaloticoccus sp.]MCF7760862.1 guanylate kinase [Cephaloticoccus sp.]